MQTISFFYDDYKKVKKVVTELKSLGVSAACTSMVARNADEPYRYAPVTDSFWDDGVIGAEVGGFTGIVLGALAATGTLGIPGLGQVVALGIVTTSFAAGVLGALSGALLGSLISLVSAKSSSSDSGTLLSVKTNDEQAASVEAIMRKGYSAAQAKRIDVYRNTDWSGLKSLTPPFGPRVPRPSEPRP